MKENIITFEARASDEKLFLESEKLRTKIYGYYSSKRSKKSFK